MRKDYAFHQHVIYLIRKDIVAELNKHSKRGMREIYVNLPCLGESVGNFSLSFILHYQPKTKGYFEGLVNEPFVEAWGICGQAGGALQT